MGAHKIFFFSGNKSIKASKVSPMPGSLINSLNPDELRDLIKFLTDSK